VARQCGSFGTEWCRHRDIFASSPLTRISTAFEGVEVNRTLTILPDNAQLEQAKCGIPATGGAKRATGRPFRLVGQGTFR